SMIRRPPTPPLFPYTTLFRSYRISLPALAATSFALVTLALGLVFFVVPNDADQGFSQRIFYFHVSIAFTAYACFGLGAWKALVRSEEHTSELQSLAYLVCRLL